MSSAPTFGQSPFGSLVRRLVPTRLRQALKHYLGRSDKQRDSLGRERPSDWYDKDYRESAQYNTDYRQSHYYFLWCVVIDRIVRGGTQSVLDVGCGPGQVASFLRDKRLPHYVGLDLSPVAIARAAELCPGYSFTAGSVFDCDLLETADYDTVLSMEFLEHVEQDLAVLNRIKSGAIFIGTVPNFPYPSHVRHFNSCEEVASRYGVLFRDFSVAEYDSPDRKCRYFLLQGVKK